MTRRNDTPTEDELRLMFVQMVKIREAEVCCRTNSNSSRVGRGAAPYAAPNERHSLRAAVRVSLN